MPQTPTRPDSLLCSLGWHSVTPFPRYNEGFYFARCRRCGNDLVRTSFSGWHIPVGHRVVWQRIAPDRAPVPAIAADDASGVIGGLARHEAAELIAARLAEPQPTPAPAAPAPAAPVVAVPDQPTTAPATAAAPPHSDPEAPAPSPLVPAAATAAAAAAASAPTLTMPDDGPDKDATAADVTAGTADPTPPADTPATVDAQDTADTASDIADPAPGTPSVPDATPVEAETAEQTDASVSASEPDRDTPPDAAGETAAASSPVAEPAVLAGDLPVDTTPSGTDAPTAVDGPATAEDDTPPPAAVEPVPAADAATVKPEAASEIDSLPVEAPEAVATDDTVPSTEAQADEAAADASEDADGPKSLVPDFMDNPWPISQISEIAAQRPRETDVTKMTMSGPLEPLPPIVPAAPSPMPVSDAPGSATPASGAIEAGPPAVNAAPAPTSPAPVAASSAAAPGLGGLGLASLDRLSNGTPRPGLTDLSPRQAGANHASSRNGLWQGLGIGSAIALAAVGGWALSRGNPDDAPPPLAPAADVADTGGTGAAPGVAFVSASRLNCRAEPTRNAASVAVLTRDRRVRVTGERGEWSSLAVVGGNDCWTQTRFLADAPRGA